MPIPLRSDFDATLVRKAARQSKDGGQARRLLALAVIYEGKSRTEAARIGGVTLQIIRDWVLKCEFRRKRAGYSDAKRAIIPTLKWATVPT